MHQSPAARLRARLVKLAGFDACIQLRNEHELKPTEVARVALTVNPRALELTGIQAPPNGLKSKWSIYHSAAVSLVDGAAGEHQYSDERIDGLGDVSELARAAAAQ